MSKICIVGNSVAKSRTREEAPLAGWGQYLGDFLMPYHEVRNYARDAMTARTYFTDRLATLLNLLEPGDVVVVDFGTVEQRIDNPMRYHGPREFKEFLYLYVDAIRNEGAVPVLLTPTARCGFDIQGNVVDTSDEYPQLIREAATETGAALVDMHAYTMQLLLELGPQRARQYYRWTDAGEHPNHPDGIIDSTHFNEIGAREVARIVAIGLHNSPGVPHGFVNPDVVALGAGYPPLLTEFTVEKPEIALHSEMRFGAPPVLLSPSPSKTVGVMQKFSGTADAGTSYILFFENGSYLGGTRVNGEGKWLWRRVVNWPAGDHLVQAVGMVDQAVSPVATVSFTVKDWVEPPIVTAPRDGSINGSRPKFSGTAEPGVSKVAVLENGRLIASAPVQEDGTWKVTHAHDWKPGTYTVEFVSVFSAIHSTPTRLTLRIHGIPEGNWIRESAASRERCSDTCDHYPFDGR
ncbi:Ig-like domain-containing protein [Streptomyces sp. NBC_01589]|uniref:Ig-like domain-containing protein n=1 Tax=Streptomyces sp. NBC_01589 TaxID=2975886 RepID=UPI003867F2F7